MQQLAQRKLKNRITLTVANLKEATALIVEKHYLHRGRTMAQLPYWVLLDERRVGVLLYSYPRMSAKFHGFSPMNLLELARIWIDPEVQGKYIKDSEGNSHAFSVASCAVGKSLRRIRSDWHGKYPHLPDVLAVVSWADMEHHEGIIYKAANFQENGSSGGSLHGSTLRRNGGHDKLNPDYIHLKRTFMYKFSRAMNTHAKTRAKANWERLVLSRNGIVAGKLPKVQGRFPLKSNTV